MRVGAGRAAAGLATVVTVVLGVRELFNLDGPLWSTILAGVVAFVLVAALVTVFVQQYLYNQATLRRERELRVVRALPKIHGSFHNLRDAGHLLHAGDPRYREKVRDALHSFSDAFGLIASADCRVCVKIAEGGDSGQPEVRIEDDKEGLTVRTFVRHHSLDLGRPDGPEPVYRNTDFDKLVSDSSLRCFFSNDLEKEVGYINSHFEGKPVDQWDYHATIVWPIRKLVEKPSPLDSEYQLVGFLCVDSRERGVFDRTVDFDLGAAFADSLYVVLHQRPEDVVVLPQGSEPIGTSEAPSAKLNP